MSLHPPKLVEQRSAMGNFAYIPISALLCYMFLLTAFVASKKNREINAFIIVLASAIMWVGGSFLMRVQFWPSIKFWYDVSIAGLLIHCWSLMNFLYEFTGSKKMGARVAGALASAVIIIINTATGLFLAAPKAVPTAGICVCLRTSRLDSGYVHCLRRREILQLAC